MELKTKQALSVVFSIAGAIGTLSTAILARKAAMKEAEMRWYYNHQTTPDQGDLDLMKPIEQIKIIGPTYIPTAIAGILTIGSIIGSTVMSHKAQASLMSMAVLADQGWRKYKNQVKSTLGINSHQDIIKGLAKKSLTQDDKLNLDDSDELELYFEENVGFFQAKPEDVMSAYAEINEFLNTDGGEFAKKRYSQKHSFGEYDGVTIGMFLESANAKIVGKVKNESLEEWGWTLDYLQEVTGNSWVHMTFSEEVTDDGVVPYKVITWIEDPIMMLDEDYEERLDLKFDEDNIEYFELEMFKSLKDKKHD